MASLSQTLGTALYVRWNFKWLAVRSCQQAIGLGVIEACFALGIEADGPAGAESDVSQVAQTRTFVSFLDVGIGPANIRCGRVLDAVDEIALMDRPFNAAPGLISLVRDFDTFFHMPAVAVEDQDAKLCVHG